MSALRITAHFEGIASEIVKRIRLARHSVRICVAWINFDIYGPVFQEVAARGVQVEVILAENPLNKTVAPSEIRAYRLRTVSTFSIMHNKFCVIDGSVVLTGSYNWSRAASGHFENIVVSEGAFDLALAFMREFEDLKSYFLEYPNLRKTPCGALMGGHGTKSCASDSFLVAIMGPEEGWHDRSDFTIWRVCRKQHVSLVLEQPYEFLTSQLGLKDDPSSDEDMECGEDVERRLQHEEGISARMRSFVSSHDIGEVRAVGGFGPINFNEHIEWEVPLEHEVSLGWRDPLYRKVIPDSFEREGEFEKMFDYYQL